MANTTEQALKQSIKDIETVLRIEGMDLEIGSRKLLREVIGALTAASAEAQPSQEQPSAPVAHQWISVKDLMPESEGWYAVLISDPDDIGWETRVWWRALFRKPENDWSSCDPVEDGQPVTHWMPLPKSPEVA